MQNNDNGIKAGYIITISICSMLLVSQFLLLLMTYFVKPELMDLSQSGSDWKRAPEIVYVVAVISMVLLVVSFVVKNVLVRQAVKIQTTVPIFMASILACSLCEAASLFGLLSAFVANFPYFYVFFAAGIIGTILHFPSRSSIDAATATH